MTEQQGQEGVESVISDKAPITTELAELISKLPSVQLPVASATQFAEIAERFMENLAELQEKRTEQLTNKTPESTNFRAIEIGEDGNGNPIRLIVTEDEGKFYTYINEAIRVLNAGDLTPFKEGKWTNLPIVNNTPCVIGSTTGERSDPSVRLRERLGLGDGRFTPLYGSGFSLSLKMPTALDQLFFQTQLAAERIEQTRRSAGFSLIASAGYMNQLFSDWALKYVDKSTIGSTDPQVIKQHMSVLDLDVLATGIASTLWPKGYPLERQCVTYNVKDDNPENESGFKTVGCGHVTKEQININRMVIHRTDRLTEDQMIQVSKRSGLIDTKTIEAYRQNLCPNVPRTYVVDEETGLVLILRIPTVYQAERVSTAWLDRLTARARTISMGGSTKDAREAYLLRANSIGRLMEYGHWIEAIGIRNNPEDEPEILFRRAEVSPKDAAEMYDADEKMDTELEGFSADEELCAKIIQIIRKFIEDVTVSWVVLSKTPCPKCGTTYAADVNNELKHPDLISISAIEFFIILLSLKIQVSGG